MRLCSREGGKLTYVFFSRVLFRLYWYPTKALYALHVAVYHYPGAPFIFLFNILLWALYFINIYWFLFIMSLVYRLVVGKEINDNRDYYDDDKENSRPDRIDKSEE